LAWWARFGETHWARGTNDRSPGQPWSEEEEAHLLKMAKQKNNAWASILKADGRSEKPIFADGRTARQLKDKYRHATASAGAAEVTDHA
jgi:hypothetical protein